MMLLIGLLIGLGLYFAMRKAGYKDQVRNQAMVVRRKAGLITMRSAGLLFILGGFIISFIEEEIGPVMVGLLMGAMPLLLLSGLASWRPLFGGATAIGLTIPILGYWIFGLFVEYEYEYIYLYSSITLIIIFLIGSILVFTSVRKGGSSIS